MYQMFGHIFGSLNNSEKAIKKLNTTTALLTIGLVVSQVCILALTTKVDELERKLEPTEGENESNTDDNEAEGV